MTGHICLTHKTKQNTVTVNSTVNVEQVVLHGGTYI